MFKLLKCLRKDAGLPVSVDGVTSRKHHLGQVLKLDAQLHPWKLGACFLMDYRDHLGRTTMNRQPQ